MDFSLGSASFDEFQSAVEQDTERMRGFQERVAAARGRGEGADGKIVAEVDSEHGLAVLDLDPRVLRLSVEDIGNEIRTAVNAAFQDFQERVGAAAGELYGTADEDPRKVLEDPSALLAKVEELGNGFAVQLQDMVRELTVQQRRAEDLAGRPDAPRDDR